MANTSLIREGALVSLTGTGPLTEVIEQKQGGLQVIGSLDAEVGSGRHAQLLRFVREDAVWLALTFHGRLVILSPNEFSPLQAEQLPPDVDFVLGPGLRDEVLAEEMAAKLILDGYCVSQALTARAEVEKMQQVSDHELVYQRVAAEFEPYYLGRDSKENSSLIDFEDAPLEVSNAFADEDTRLTRLGDSISPLLRDRLGIRITGRTNLMVRKSFRDSEEEAMCRPEAQATEGERESFISLVKRRRVCLMHFLGPLTGKLVLIPRDSAGAGAAKEIEIEASPGKMVVFMTERYWYSHTCSEGATTTLQTWLLGQRPEYLLGSFGGDMSILAPPVEAGMPPPQGESVCVTGVSTFIGGDSRNPACYWLATCKAGTDTVVKMPTTRFDTTEYCHIEDMYEAQSQGKSYTHHQGYVDGIEFFDARFFGISNQEAGSMDPNQRKTLEVAYECIALAGHTLKSLQKQSKHIGAFVGVSGSEWGHVPHPMDTAGCGQAEAIISNRINFALNLKGASQTINTACSAGLVAMHTAKLHLKYKDFDPLDGVIATGTQLSYAPLAFVGCCGGGMLSFKGRCFTYDVSADGYLRGEGISGVHLELAGYTQEVYCAVPASQANQDGRSASITAPNGPSQEKCIKACFREAAIKPSEVDCFETHGTGTALGDPIEVGAFRRIYVQVPRINPLLVTSAKTNLGHLEGGAGMAGFIKCVNQVMRCEAGPNLHLRERNPHLDVEGFPAQFLSEGLCTQYDSCITGVSSFGFGGTNAHAMAYSQNCMTSKKAGRKDYRGLLMQKIMEAAPPKIMKNGSNPEDWDSSGAPLGEEKIGKTYEVEMDADGTVVWREVVETPPDPSAHDCFGIAGSFTGWTCASMARVPGLPGVYAAELTLGEDGQEFFHVLGDEDGSMIYYPAEPRSKRRLVPVLGPKSIMGNPEDFAWCIEGKPGSRYRVEFRISPRNVEVTWLRIAEVR